jgi:hypothetical protein
MPVKKIRNKQTWKSREANEPKKRETEVGRQLHNCLSYNQYTVSPTDTYNIDDEEERNKKDDDMQVSERIKKGNWNRQLANWNKRCHTLR